MSVDLALKVQLGLDELASIREQTRRKFRSPVDRARSSDPRQSLDDSPRLLSADLLVS